ncbi:hypothetical protein [Lentzea albidocapillata]|nr:hypothetical protein [Lentzea albidocapillata]
MPATTGEARPFDARLAAIPAAVSGGREKSTAAAISGAITP